MTEEIVHDHTLQEELDVETYIEEMKQMEYLPKRMINAGARYICPYGCGKLIAMRTIDYHKNNGCGRRTELVTHNTELKKRYYCCGVCYVEFVTRAEFHAHLRVDHDVHPEIHNCHFKDRRTFDRFVRWLEMEGGAHFRHKSGTKRRGRGKGIFLACNRSGFVNSAHEKESSDRTGPFRLGYSCTAYIHATEHADGHVTAEACPDHYGHDARMRLPNIIKYIIAHKQLEGETPVEIIGYLRNHFMSFSQENIYAQRICFVDAEELKAIYTSSTKKWEQVGIPQKCDVWEEELLDNAGIVREGVPRLRGYHEKTSSELAKDEVWPRPRVFVAKIRTEDGLLVPVDVARDGGLPQELIQTEEYPQNENVEVDEARFVEMGMEEFVDDAYGDDSQVQQNLHQNQHQFVDNVVKPEKFGQHDQQLLEDEDVEVEVETEVETTSQQIPMTESEIRSLQGGEEVVIVERMMQRAGPSKSRVQEQEHIEHVEETLQTRFYDGPNALTITNIMEELDAMKLTVLKRADVYTGPNLRAFLIRIQSLHNSISDKNSAGSSNSTEQSNHPITIFPSRQRMSYRPGKGLERPDSQFLNVRGDVTLLPIEDEMSDDEVLTENNRDLVPFNSNIWS